MTTVRLFVEGGGSFKDTKRRCGEGFHKLLENCGFGGRLPRIIVCGSRRDAYEDFVAQRSSKYIDILLIDSEDPVLDMDRPWAHLKQRTDDGWDRPDGATDDRVLMMTTCMETWIVADRAAIRTYFHDDGPRRKLNEGALPAVDRNLEQRHRHSVQDALERATGKCKNPYAKGKRSFEVLALLSPDTLEENLPSFGRARRILRDVL